ncbi:MAG: AgmX/PglI C-terminal domain-containing protein [Myxococcota bacterium]
MSGQAAVLQVVILRDGLLVGTEVFVPGTYVVGSAPTCDLRLDDTTVEPNHAVLYFQNGKAAVQDQGGTSGVFVNGHRVTACEVRPVDEVTCGPFSLKVRVIGQKPAAKPAPPPEVAALLKSTPMPQPAPKKAAPAPTAAPAAPPRPPPQQYGKMPTPAASAPATMLSARRMAAAPVVASGMNPSSEPGKTAHLRPVSFDDDIVETQSLEMADLMSGTVPSHAPEPPTRAERPKAAPPKPPAPRSAGRAVAAALRPSLPSLTGADKVAKRPKLFFELYWGDLRRDARSFGTIKPKKPVIAAADDKASLPLYGFTLPDEPFVIAEQVGDAYRVYVPRHAAVEKGRNQDFHPLSSDQLEVDGGRRFLTLSDGMAARFSEGQMTLVAYVQPPIKRPFVNPLAGVPFLLVFLLAVFVGGGGAFLALAPKPADTADFQQKNLPPVAVRLIAPEPKKKEEAKKKLEELKAKKVEKEKKVVVKEREVTKGKEKTPPPVASAPESKALKALAKLSAAGPAAGDILAAVDKLGNGPGSKLAKNSNYKLSGLLGKAPIANAGLGTFGLGGGGGGGFGTKGAEILRGKGGGGIGALGAGGVGRGAVGGTVTRATTRTIGVAQGSIDREAVAKVVNSHLQEVRGCYERALLKDPGLAGKVVLEWSIGATGVVMTAKTKSSTLRNAAVEGCILGSLKKWVFPKPKGGIVIVSYPFLFNSVGY